MIEHTEGTWKTHVPHLGGNLLMTLVEPDTSAGYWTASWWLTIDGEKCITATAAGDRASDAMRNANFPVSWLAAFMSDVLRKAHPTYGARA